MRKTAATVLLVLVVVGSVLLAFQPGTASASAPSETMLRWTGIYTVQRGDCLYNVALRFGTTVEAIARANDIRNPSLIFVGQQLVVPVPGQSSAEGKPVATNTVAAGAEVAKVDNPRVPPPTPASPAPTVTMSARAAALLAGLNEQRIAAGLHPLRYEPALLPTAQARSDDMANRNYFSHTTPEGNTVHDLLNAAGLRYAVANEILARNNYADDQSVGVAVNAFMASSPHRSHVLEAAYGLAAVAEARTAEGMKYFTVILASAR